MPEQIAHTLRLEISEGRIPPGTKLPEVLFSESMGVSRHTIRSAFQVLEEDGMARREPNRGVFVISPSASDILELYRIRRIVEPGVVRTVLFDETTLDALSTIVENAVSSDLDSLAKANQDFHRFITDQARSELLSRTMGRVLAQMRLAFSHHDITIYREFREKHFTILYLMRRGSTDAAAQVLDDYLQDSEAQSIAALQSSAATR